MRGWQFKAECDSLWDDYWKTGNSPASYTWSTCAVAHSSTEQFLSSCAQVFCSARPKYLLCAGANTFSVRKCASIALLEIKVEENAFLAHFGSNSVSDSISNCVEICDNLVFPSLMGSSYFLGSSIAADTFCAHANSSTLSNLDLPCIRCTKNRFQ